MSQLSQLKYTTNNIYLLIDTAIKYSKIYENNINILYLKTFTIGDQAKPAPAYFDICGTHLTYEKHIK